MAVNFTLVMGFFVAMLAILNPIGNTPVFLDYVGNVSNDVQKMLAKLLALTLFLIAFFFYFTGEPFLKLFGITIPAFRIAGGILIMRLGIHMLSGKPKGGQDDKEPASGKNSFKEAYTKLSDIIVPVALPIFMGPGAITTVILYSQQAQGFLTNFFMILSLAAVCTLIGTELYFSRLMLQILGKNGMQIVTRTMGLLLCAIAVQFVINGVDQIIPGVLNPAFTHNAPIAG